MARSAHPPSARQEMYRGRPMLRASEARPTTRALLEHRFGPLEFIARGGYGEVWRTGKDRIIKATASEAEAYCVSTILDSHIRSPWLPEVFSAGWFTGARFTWCSDPDVPEEEQPELEYHDRCPQAASIYEPVFWYEREDVHNIPPHVTEMVFDIWREGYAEAASKWTRKKGRKSEAWRSAARIARAIRAAMIELPINTGLFPIDSWPPNWGLTGKGQVVLRDLACGSADMMYDEESQNTEVDVQEWPPPSPWDQVWVPKEVGAPPADPGLLELRIEWPDLFAIFKEQSKEAWQAESRRYREARVAIGHQLLELLQQRRALEVTDPRRQVAYVALLQRDGTIRLGRFDARGPVGHVEIPPGEGQALEFAEDLARSLERHPDEHTTTLRILSPDRSLVDFWMKQPLGKWGTKALEIVQNSNARRASGDYEGANAYERAEYEKLGAQPPETPIPDTVGGPREKPYNGRDDRLAVIAQMRVREPLEGERTTHSGTLAIRLGPDMTEEWDWTAMEGRQAGGKGRTGRIVMDLPRNPAAGLVWADFDGQPKIVAIWTEELLRRHRAMRALIAVYRQHVSPRVVIVGPFSTAGRAAAAALADAIEDEPDESTTAGPPRPSYKTLKEALELPPDTNLVDLIERLHPHATDPAFRPWVAPAPAQHELDERAAPEPRTWLLSSYRRARIREAVQHLFGDWHGHRQRSDAEPGPGGDPLLWRCVGIGIELCLEAAGHLIGACHGRFAAARLDARQQPLQGRALEAREREDLEVFAYVRRAMDLAWDWFQQDNPTQTFWPVVHAAAQNEQLLIQLSEPFQPGLQAIRRTCGERTLGLIHAFRDASWNLLTWILGHREQGRESRPQSPLWEPAEQLPWVLRALEGLTQGWAQAFDTLAAGDQRWPWFINEVARRCRSRVALRLQWSPLVH